VKGKHTSRARAAPSRGLLAAGCSLLVVTGGIAIGLTVRGHGAPGPASPAAAAGATASPTPIRTAASAGSAPSARHSAHKDPFGPAAASYVSARVGTVSAAVYDIGTGQTWRLGSGRPQAEASVVKLDVLEALLAERDATGAGLTPSDRSLAGQMIEDSDNDAATSLWYEVGGPAKIRSFNAAVGLTSTSPSSCVVCPGFASPGWGLSTTVPTDQIALLRELVTPGTLLTGTARSYALSLMENVIPSQRWGVSGGVPAQATVALKNGWLPLDSADRDWQVNSVGWISGLGRDYLIALLTTGNPTEQYGIDTIDRLATLVWQHMG
jgi:beta-lactamase class A